jgi:hypothetical protein
MPPGVNRVAPTVHAKRPQSDAVRGELAMKDKRLLAHAHRDEERLDPDDRVGWCVGHRRGLHSLEPPGFAHLRVTRSQVAHHQRRSDRVMAFAPYRRANRNHLADHGFCRIGAARYDGRDVIDFDTTRHRYSF